MAGKIITWNGVSSSTVPYLILGEILRDPLGRIRSNMIEVPGAEGSWSFPQPRGRRIITCEAAISAPSREALRSAIADFATWLDIEGDAKLAISDDPGIHHVGTLRGAEVVKEWNGLGRFNIGWEVGPYSLDDTVTEEDWTSGVGTLHTWDPGLIAHAYPTIVITPTNGTIFNFTLETNGFVLQIANAVIAQDQAIVINGISATVTSGPNIDTELTGAYDPDKSLIEYVTGDFPVLLPNQDNDIRYTHLGGSATSFDIEVDYRKRYRR